MSSILPRRSFLAHSAAVTSGFLGLNHLLHGKEQPLGGLERFGPLQPDPNKIIDLPKGFSYQILSRSGESMSDGFRVPGQPDGMGAFTVGAHEVLLIRNHEIGHSRYETGLLEDNRKLPEDFDKSLCYDPGRFDGQPFVGGTTSILYDTRKQNVTQEYLSLFGTDRNCAGGITPWNSWITCEEPSDTTSQWGAYHGYCFEVPAKKKAGLCQPVPLKAMGRFRHEAVAVHPGSGAVYLTEDRSDGALYRFLPEVPGQLAKGGRLQALAIKGWKSASTRNWPTDSERFPLGEKMPVTWIDMEEVEAPLDDLRLRAIEKGATQFSRGEGIWYGAPEAVGEESIYWACTDGGRNQKGQIFRYYPSPEEGATGESKEPGQVELFLEPNDTALLQNGDNIAIAPWGDLYICEDTSGPPCLRVVNQRGEISTIAKNALNKSEFAGACFDPQGSTLFMNIQSPGITLAISGPFQK